MLIPDSAKIQYYSTFVSRKINEDNVFIYGNPARVRTRQNTFRDTSPRILGSNLKNILNLKFKFLISDNLNNLKVTGFWFNNQTISKYLKYRIFICLSEEETQLAASFNKQEIVFDDNRYFDIGVDTFKKREFSLREFGSLQNNKTDFFTEVDKNIFVEKLTDINFLALVCHTYLDRDMIAKDFNVDFNSLVGVREYFFAEQPTGQLLIDNNNIRPAANVIDVSGLENLKTLLLEDPEDLKETKQEYFSDIFASHSFETEEYKGADSLIQKYVIRYGFFFDHIKLLEDTSIYNKFLKLPPNDSLRKEFIENAKILNAKLTRLKTTDIDRKGNYEEKVVTNTFTGDSNFIPRVNPETNRKEDVIYFYSISNLLDLLFITGKDSDFFSLDGEYRYRFDIEVLDPAYKLLSKIKQRVEEDIARLLSYKTRACLPVLQAQNEFNINPYIDPTQIFFNTQISNIKTGYFIPSENRFTDNLNDDILDEIINNFINFFKLFSGSEDTILNSNGVTFDNIKKSIGKSTGNPENLQLFIQNYGLLLENINKILSKKITANSLKPSAATAQTSISRAETPTFIQTIKKSITFDNFNFKALETLPISFQYFTSDRSLGLKEMRSAQINNEKNQLLETITINKSIFEFYKLNILGDLEITSLIKNITANIQALPTTQNNKDYIINFCFQVLYSVYAFLDILLTIKDEQELNSCLENFTEEYRKIATTLGVQDLFKLVMLSVNPAINIFLIKNQISTKNIFEVIFSKIIDDNDIKVKDFDIGSEKILQAVEAFKNLHNMFVASGINNASKRVENSTEFENKINYYTSNTDYINLNKIFIKEDSGFINPTIEKSGRFKIKADTLKLIKYIDFEKDKNNRYLLKSPVLRDFYADAVTNKILDIDKGIRLLGFFQNYINEAINVNSSLYKNIPVLDQYFYLNFDTLPPEAPDINITQPPAVVPESPSTPVEPAVTVYPVIVTNATVVTPSFTQSTTSRFIEIKVNNFELLNYVNQSLGSDPNFVFTTPDYVERYMTNPGYLLKDEQYRWLFGPSNLFTTNENGVRSGLEKTINGTKYKGGLEYFFSLTPKLESLQSGGGVVEFSYKETMMYLYLLPVLRKVTVLEGSDKTSGTPAVLIDWEAIKQSAENDKNSANRLATKLWGGAAYSLGWITTAQVIKQPFKQYATVSKLNFIGDPLENNGFFKDYDWDELFYDTYPRFTPFYKNEFISLESSTPFYVANYDNSNLDVLYLLTDEKRNQCGINSRTGLFTFYSPTLTPQTND